MNLMRQILFRGVQVFYTCLTIAGAGAWASMDGNWDYSHEDCVDLSVMSSNGLLLPRLEAYKMPALLLTINGASFELQSNYRDCSVSEKGSIVPEGDGFKFITDDSKTVNKCSHGLSGYSNFMFSNKTFRRVEADGAGRLSLEQISYKRSDCSYVSQVWTRLTPTM